MVLNKEKFVKIPAGKFKAECLKLMDKVAKHHTEIIITKRGKPVARLLPVKTDIKAVGAWGWMKNSVEVVSDIVSPVDVKWKVDE